jgi:DNA-binding CsgD family transcriptional regulator
MGVEESTAAVHIAHAALKLGASNRPHLVTRAFVYGILRVIEC